MIYLASGKFPGGLFPWFYVPGVLALLSWLLARLTSGTSNPAVNPLK
jgi:hypothetical protein